MTDAGLFTVATLTTATVATETTAKTSAATVEVRWDLKSLGSRLVDLQELELELPSTPWQKLLAAGLFCLLRSVTQ